MQELYKKSLASVESTAKGYSLDYTITEDEIKAAIRKGTLAMQINPMTCGSSFKNKGVQTLLDAVCAFLPSPEDTPAIEGTDPSDSEKKI